MQVFPEHPRPLYPLTVSQRWKTEISKNGSQRRGLWMFPKFDVKVKYRTPTLPEAITVWNFYAARKGALEGFYIYDLVVFDHSNIYLGTGDGVTAAFDIPGKSTSGHTLYTNGTELTSGFSYDYAIGDGGSDRVVFTSIPGPGDIVTMDFTGYLRIKCRFSHDNLDRENVIRSVMRYGIELTGL
ncbi:MAG: DUF2460 domain-containing protein [Desulfobacterales bacterium]|nr:DUF2460 domain-containing protein [Desulfobacterales bacterium]